jgi:hypothetical protein
VVFIAANAGGATFAPLKVGALRGELAAAIDAVLRSTRPAAITGPSTIESRTA